MSEQVAQRAERIAARVVREGFRARQDLSPVPLTEHMETLGVPGVSVAVVNGGVIEWARGYGAREAGVDDPVTPETMFQAASISKPVAVMGALRLVQAGVLDLDEDVNTYLKAWKLPANDGWQPHVTLRLLMCHGAGTTVHGFAGYNRRAAIPTVPQVLDGVPPANCTSVRVSAIPGTQFRYSGGGTTVMQQVMTDVTGRPFPDLMRDLVLEPLGMEHSTYEQPLPERSWPQAATGHRSAAIPLDGKWHVYPEMAAAGLWTTPTDLARVVIDVQRAWAGEPDTLLTLATVREMLSPQVEGHIGLGFFLQGEEPSSRFGHEGTNEGFQCALAAYRDLPQGAVVMTNGDDGWTITSDLLLTIAREYDWLAYSPVQRHVLSVAPPRQGDYVGEYELKPGFRFIVTQRDGTLFLRSTGQEPFPLYPFSDTEYFASAVKAEVIFGRDDGGSVTELTLRQDDREMAAHRVPQPGREWG